MKKITISCDASSKRISPKDFSGMEVLPEIPDETMDRMGSEYFTVTGAAATIRYSDTNRKSPHVLGYPVCGLTTNDAESLAILIGLGIVDFEINGADSKRGTLVTIFSDSRVAVSYLTGSGRFKSSSEKASEIRKLAKARVESLNRKKVDVRLCYVGRNTTEDLEISDHISREMRRLAQTFDKDAHRIVPSGSVSVGRLRHYVGLTRDKMKKPAVDWSENHRLTLSSIGMADVSKWIDRCLAGKPKNENVEPEVEFGSPEWEKRYFHD